jgi:hypothetical protein
MIAIISVRKFWYGSKFRPPELSLLLDQCFSSLNQPQENSST